MDYFFNQKIAKNMAFLLNTIFLCMHIFFFLFFSYYHVGIMANFNIFSMIFYFCSYPEQPSSNTSTVKMFLAYTVFVCVL